MYKLRHINILLVLKFLSISLMVISAIMIVPAIVSFLNSDGELLGFFISIISVFLVGVFSFAFNPASIRQAITLRDSFLIILVMWIGVPFAGMLPFYLASPIDSFSDALFESFSGFTTTGFSHLFAYEEYNQSIIVWKSIIQWLGGMGLLIFVIALFPFIKEGEIKVFFSDIQDTSYKPLHQKITFTARRLWYVYLSFSFLGVLSLYLAGNDFFHSFTIALSSISTSGGIYNHGNVSDISMYSKIVIVVLMLIAGANYFYVYQLVNRKANAKNEEFKTYLLIIFAAFALVTLAHLYKYGLDFNLIFESLFNSVAFVSTCGFYTNNSFDASILFVWMILFFLLFIGSSTGSSGGGINIYRIVILVKSLSVYIKSILHPNYYPQVKFNSTPIPNKVISRVFAFFVLYFIIFLAGSILLSISGLDFEQSISFCAASLSNSGASVFLLTDYVELSSLNGFSKYTLIMLMLIGRIELFPFLLLFSKTFWKV